MKKLLLVLPVMALAACSSHPEIGQPKAPLDTNSVSAYNAKVYSGNTVPVNQQVNNEKPVDMPLNASDSRPRVTQTRSAIPPVVLMPSIGYHYGYHRHRFH
ncbi:hypothetical protein A4G18_07600 [Pasteurellaceae bacterium Pebbles2]|nr:hypothetical protein [Pasteurellaceae bacterium Pebbles2]